MKIIGLTGGMASGKSAAARYLRGRGISVLDADEISRELTRKGAPGAAALKKELGREYFNGDEPDRAAIARWAFSSPENTARLNELIHPLVIERLKSSLVRLEGSGENAVVIDCPLLFESGLDKLCSQVWLITADYETRIRRAAERSGLTRQQAEERMSRQMSDSQRVLFSDEIIDNNGSLSELEEKLKPLADRLLGDENGQKRAKN